MAVKDLPTLEASRRMAMASVPLDRIAQNAPVSAWVQKNKGQKLNLYELLRLVSIILNHCYDDAAEALSCLTGKGREEIDTQPLAVTLKDIDDFAGGNILSFFSLSSGTAQEK